MGEFSIEKAIRKINRIKYLVTPTGCHIPINLRTNKRGRIQTTFMGRQMNLSRLVAFSYHGLDVHNLDECACHIRECPNKHCFNKNHIYKGSHKDNMIDAVATKTHYESKKTHCPNGHLLTGRIRRRDGRRERYCITCSRVKNKLRRLKSL